MGRPKAPRKTKYDKPMFEVNISLPIATIERYQNLACDLGISRAELILTIICQGDPSVVKELPPNRIKRCPHYDKYEPVKTVKPKNFKRRIELRKQMGMMSTYTNTHHTVSLYHDGNDE